MDTSRWVMSFVIGVMISGKVLAQIVPAEQLLHQSEQRQAALEARLTPSGETASLTTQPTALPSIDHTERCFPVTELEWTSLKDNDPSDDHALQTALSTEQIDAHYIGNHRYRLTQRKTATAPCLSASLIQRIITKAQNSLIDQGYVTTRVLTPEQDLRTGMLKLSLAVGKVGQLMVNPANGASTHADRANLWNAFPTHPEKTLQLRDLEQGLENLRRLPSVTAQMDIRPSDRESYSDIIVDWQQRSIPLRFYASIDNSGSKVTGQYLGTISLAWDNPLHLNDIFNASYTHNLTAGEKHTDPHGHTDKSSTNNYALNYSIPFGYWQLSIGMSHYYYDQIVAGVNQNYHYSGQSSQGSLNLSRVLYRDSTHKISAEAGLWRKTTRSYIDDSELDIQRRRVGGWTAGINSRSTFNLGSLSTRINYKRGTRAFGAIPVPEELFNEGTGKMKIWSADIDWSMPFTLRKENFQWNSSFHGQWNKSPLTTQDRYSIGGLYSVRGFNGEKTLSAERGWTLRNDLSWRYHDSHQLYLGLDTGHVAGASAQNLPGRTLTGGVLGIKGQFSAKGQWNYDIFLGKPLHQPTGFKADKTVFGFNFSYGI